MLDQEYSLHVVVPHFLALPKNDLNDFVTDLLRASPNGNVPRMWRRSNIAHFLQDWVIAHYQEIGLLPRDPDAVLSQAIKRTSFFDIARSGAAFVTRRNSKKILALARIDVDTEQEERLGLEKLLIEMGLASAPFPRAIADEYVARPEKNDFRIIFLPDGQFQFGMVRQTALDPVLLQQRPAGASAEILNYNLVEGSYDFVPLLYLAMEAFGLTKWSGKLTQSTGQAELIGIDDYHLHCEGDARRHYFELRGWQVIDTYPNPHFKRHGKAIPNYVMAIRRTDFKTSLERMVLSRNATIETLMLHLALDDSQMNQARCQNVIVQHSGYPVYLGPNPRIQVQ